MLLLCAMYIPKYELNDVVFYIVLHTLHVKVH